jgi:hypothetical protein
MMGRRKWVAIKDIVRRESIARGMTGGGTVVGTDVVIVTTETVTGLRSTGGGRGQGPETVSRIASVRTSTVRARVQGNTGGIDRGVKSDAVMKTATEDHETTIAMPKERQIPSVRRGVDPTAVEADRGRLTSTQGHAERRDKQKLSIIQNPFKPDSFEQSQRNPATVPPTA